jgi:hypothetical protein
LRLQLSVEAGAAEAGGAGDGGAVSPRDAASINYAKEHGKVRHVAQRGGDAVSGSPQRRRWHNVAHVALIREVPEMELAWGRFGRRSFSSTTGQYGSAIP